MGIERHQERVLRGMIVNQSRRMLDLESSPTPYAEEIKVGHLRLAVHFVDQQTDDCPKQAEADDDCDFPGG